MSLSHHGLDGAIGPPKTADYSGKAALPPGTKTYVKTFGRLSLTGGIIRHDRSYAGKIELEPLVEGAAQAQNATVAGAIHPFAIHTLSGTVQAQSSTMSGTIPNDKTVSGTVQAQSSAVSGAVDDYPITGYSLVTFTVDFAGLDPDSPYTDAAYSALLTGDKSHFETLTDPSGSTMTMNGLGEFTISPPSTVTETFDHQIYDASDGTFGTLATITIQPAAADVILSGGVQSQVATVSGSLDNFAVHTSSGGVQSQNATMFGVLTTTANLDLVFGGVQSGSSTVSGTLERVITSQGSVQAQNATVTGDLNKVVKGSGGVQAQRATLTGSVQAGVVLLPPNIADVPKRTSTKRKLNRKIKFRSLKR